ncbi:MAG: sigma-54 dependent transcriptional regulator [Proteobacteria bacterium]|nr:sigma-54 dependent transcriptional regulator [Pseudomonadota bacterium]MBU4295732.1 sigma-54 dependent transcriptional regulator [Pseudomonadota bacterium]MCG2747151.1 sigma-54 dependent transcriptional regulator [Desulfobulbaceae bacterium]
MAQILVVDDEEKIRLILNIMLTAAGHQVFEAESGRAALAVLEREAVDLVISDMRMDEMGGIELLASIREKELGCPLVFITAFATLESAVEALRLGAADYLVKPFEEKDVLLAVERSLGVRRLLAENIRLKKESVADGRTAPGIFVSQPMQQVHTMALKVAASEATVLLTGESGTGKEVVAHLIHQASNRCHERFVAVNCAAMAPSLLEAELFGHEKGSFTGADKVRVGKFEFAGGGTLFLDEIGELPLEAQAKLLRAIQEKSLQRVGGNQEIPIRCRLVCATNQDLARLVSQDFFREDLFYRLAVFPIHMPPLRERRPDIVPLVRHCIEKLSGRPVAGEILTPAAQKLLGEYPWPGNIRELFNVVERAMIMKDGATPFSSDDFPYLCSREAVPSTGDDVFKVPAIGLDYEELQRSIVRQSLELTAGNQSAAARLLRVSRARFRTLLSLIEAQPSPPGGSGITVRVQRIVIKRGVGTKE